MQNWLDQAIQPQASSHAVTVNSAEVHFRQWPSQSDRQGLLLVHGHAANAHWWDWIAPGLMERFNVAAIDLTGNGDSGHRSVYSSATYAEEMLAVSQAAGQEAPVLVGHSFGGTLARLATYLHPDAFSALLLIDSALPAQTGRREPPTMPRVRTRHYKSLQQAMRRFRLRPPQPAPAPEVIRHIAEHAVRKEPQGYRFKLDPAIFAKMTDEPPFPDARSMLAGLKVPCGLIYGEHSRFFDPDSIAAVTPLFREGCVRGVTGAHHHLFLDDPEQSLDVMREVLDRLVC